MILIFIFLTIADCMIITPPKMATTDIVGEKIFYDT